MINSTARKACRTAWIDDRPGVICAYELRGGRITVNGGTTEMESHGWDMTSPDS
jgi:hypothetical protein